MSPGRLAAAEVLGSNEFVSAPQEGADFLIFEEEVIRDDRIETPLDSLTGLPLPVFARSSDYRMPNGMIRRTNFHHHFHPSRSPLLGYDAQGIKLARDDPDRVEGFALRYSRGQEIPVWLHDRYHDVFSGPALPSESSDKFTRVVLSCAGVVPTRALDLSRAGEYKEVSLNSKQHEFIRRRIYFEGAASLTKSSKRSHIGKYIAEYALQNTLLNVVNEKEIHQKAKEFMRPKSEVQRIEAGRFILSQAVGASVVNLIELHDEAKREGMVKKSKKSLGQVVLKFFTLDRFQDYFVPMEKRLQTVV